MWLNHRLTLNNLTVWWWRQSCALIILIIVLNMLWEVPPLQGRKGKLKGKVPYWTAELARWYDRGGGLELNSQTIKKKDTVAPNLVRLYIIGWLLIPATDNQEFESQMLFHGFMVRPVGAISSPGSHALIAVSLVLEMNPGTLYFQSLNLKFSIHLEG